VIKNQTYWCCWCSKCDCYHSHKQAWDLRLHIFNVFRTLPHCSSLKSHMRKKCFLSVHAVAVRRSIRQACRTRSAGHQTGKLWWLNGFESHMLHCQFLLNLFGRICTIICTIFTSAENATFAIEFMIGSHMTWWQLDHPFIIIYHPSNLFCPFGMPVVNIVMLPFVLGPILCIFSPRCSGGFTWLW